MQRPSVAQSEGERDVGAVGGGEGAVVHEKAARESGLDHDAPWRIALVCHGVAHIQHNQLGATPDTRNEETGECRIHVGGARLAQDVGLDDLETEDGGATHHRVQIARDGFRFRQFRHVVRLPAIRCRAGTWRRRTPPVRPPLGWPAAPPQGSAPAP